MAKKTAKTNVKLDQQGFIFPLAVGALALLFFSWYFLTMSKPKTAVVKDPIQSVEDLNKASKDLEGQSPDTFKSELDSNSVDASGL